jgi:hypothetical protein
MNAKILSSLLSVKAVIGGLSVACVLVACVMTGCVSGGLVPHEDSPAATKRDDGPALCRDGTIPPCNTRS